MRHEGRWNIDKILNEERTSKRVTRALGVSVAKSCDYGLCVKFYGWGSQSRVGHYTKLLHCLSTLCHYFPSLSPLHCHPSFPFRECVVVELVSTTNKQTGQFALLWAQYSLRRQQIWGGGCLTYGNFAHWSVSRTVT